MEWLYPDYTLFIQLGIFMTCYLIMKFLVFKPYLRLLELREAKTEGLRQKARACYEEADKLQSGYEEFIGEERQKIAHWLDGERQRLNEEERTIYRLARTEVAEKLKVVQKEIETQSKASRQQLLEQVPELAKKIVTKLIGQEVDLPESGDSGPGQQLEMAARPAE